MKNANNPKISESKIYDIWSTIPSAKVESYYTNFTIDSAQRIHVSIGNYTTSIRAEHLS